MFIQYEKRCVMRAGEGFLSLALAAMLMIGCSDSPTSTPQPTSNGTTSENVQPEPIGTQAPGVELYRTVMNGTQEVPEVGTLASGSASFHMSNDGSSIVYAITVSNIKDVTDAHIHVGAPGEVGAPVVDLFDGMKAGDYDGLLVQGTITADDLVGSLTGMTLEDLGTLVSSGRAYVNVHTSMHPAGEIRGQLTRVPDQDDDDGSGT
jgi:hypothetical protein